MSAVDADPLALTRQAAGEYAQRRYMAAADAFAKLTRLQPANASHWMNLGTCLRAAKRLDEAFAAYARAGALRADSADFYYNVGLLHLDRGDFGSARIVLRDALERAPDDAGIAWQLAQCCYEELRIDEALDALDGWQRMKGLTSERVAAIALLLMNLGEPRLAEPAIEHVRRDPAPSAQARLKLAQVLERTNRIDEARAELVALDPADAAELGEDLVLLEAQLAQRERRHDEASTAFATLASACDETHRRHLYLYPLAKSLDALGRHDEAFATLEQAHASQVAQLHRTMPQAAVLREPPMLITRYRCNAADVAAWDHAGAPAADESPVFIVAFPRSGTTLLEQTLDAHPALATMDEQPFLQGAIDRLQAFGVEYPHELAALSGAQLAEARAAYLEQAARKVSLSPGQRLLDKNPLNMLRLPVIRRLFPHARILLAIRHPCDVLLSCYMQHFRAPEFALLCRDPATLARGYDRAFDFWYSQAALLEPAVLEVRYEDFVADFERHVRAIAAFLELPWDDAMLAPAAHARARGFISTPSYAQVVQPVHTRAVGRWKPYERHLAGALESLAPWIDRWSYAR